MIQASSAAQRAAWSTTARDSLLCISMSSLKSDVQRVRPSSESQSGIIYQGLRREVEADKSSWLLLQEFVEDWDERGLCLA